MFYFVLFFSVFVSGLACGYIGSIIGKLLAYTYPFIYNEFSCTTVIKKKLVLFQIDLYYCGNRLVFSFDFFS